MSDGHSWKLRFCFADYKYKILISFKIYVVLYQYQSTQFKKYKLINYNSSESVIAKSSKFWKRCIWWTIFNFSHSTKWLIILTLVIYWILSYSLQLSTVCSRFNYIHKNYDFFVHPTPSVRHYDLPLFLTLHSHNATFTCWS